MFVYGTLKRGFENHARFCWDALYAGEAVVRGRLYELPAGYPGLVVPGESVRATGTVDPWDDMETQIHLGSSSSAVPKVPTGDWDTVYGELLAFANPGRQLPPIDRLEGFVPGGPSLYRRVLLPVNTGDSSTLAWTYVVKAPSNTYLPGGHWPG